MDPLGVHMMPQVIHRTLQKTALLQLQAYAMVLQPTQDLCQVLQMLRVIGSSYQDVIQVADCVSMPCSMVSIAFWEMAGADAIPNGSRV